MLAQVRLASKAPSQNSFIDYPPMIVRSGVNNNDNSVCLARWTYKCMARSIVAFTKREPKFVRTTSMGKLAMFRVLVL